MLVSYLQALYIAIDRPCKEFVGHQIENNTWVCGNTRFILSIEHDISRVSTAKSEISCSTQEINLVFPSTHVFFCLLYKQNSVKNNKTSVAMRFTTNDIFTHKKYSIFCVCLNTIFLSGQKLYITLMFI